MKDFLLLNYNIKIKKIYLKNGKRFFFLNNEKVFIVEVDDIENIKKLIGLTNYMYSINIKVNTFIKNNDNDYFSKRKNSYILLIKENDFGYVSIDSFNKFYDIKNMLDEYNIIKEWEKEIDYFENKIIEYNDEYINIQKSINYYIGISENAIQLLNNYKNNNVYDSIGHKIDYNFFDDNIINDPFSFIKTNRMYDIANYIKYCFYNNKVNYDEISIIIKNNNEYENAFLFSCLLYQNIYFSMVKDIVLNGIDEKKLDIIISKKDEYLSFLIEIKRMIKNVNKIVLINWID